MNKKEQIESIRKFIPEVYIVFYRFYLDEFILNRKCLYEPRILNEEEVRKKSEFLDCYIENLTYDGRTTLNFRYFFLRISMKGTIDNLSYLKDIEIYIELTRYNNNPNILNKFKVLGQENGFRVIPTSKEKIIYINFIDEKWSI